MKKKFQILNRVTNTGKNSYIPPLIDQGLVVHKPIEKANLFNKQFAKKATLAGYQDEAPLLEPIPVTSELDGLLTSHYEIGPLIRSLKPPSSYESLESFSIGQGSLGSSSSSPPAHESSSFPSTLPSVLNAALDPSKAGAGGADGGATAKPISIGIS